MQQAIHNTTFIKTTPRNTTRLLALALWLTTLCLTMLFLPGLAQASTLNVPAQYSTIQAAIDASSNGDTVLIADGTYTGSGNVDLDFGGRNITVTSVDGPNATIINCQGNSSASHRGFYLHSGETNAIISGLTIKNGYEYNGGGIFIYGASVTIQNCVLRGNTAASGNGGGIESYGDNTVTVENCMISGNTANDGGGIANDNDGSSSGTVSATNCVISGNTAVNGDAGGIGVFGAPGDYSITSVIDCTISANEGSGVAGSAGYYANCFLNMTNVILYGDTAGEVNVGPSDPENNLDPLNVAATYCDIQGGVPSGTTDNGGNINANPQFVNANDPHLLPGSPCLGAGTASGTPTTTLDGHTRPNPPSIGAYEVTTVPVPTNLTATAGGGKITLNWNAPAGVVVSTYSVYRGTASGTKTYFKSASGTGTTFADTSVTAGTTYYYAVRTIVGSYSSPSSNEVHAIPLGVPAAPTNLKAVAGVGKVALTWTASTGPVTSYSVYRGTSATTLTFYKTAGTATNFTNTYVVNGTTYYYAVAAVNSAGSSPQSAVVSATPLALPSAPSHLAAVASGGKITLNWTASTGTVTSYSVYRGTTSGGEIFYKTANTATMFVNALVTHGTKYYYTIKALNGSGTSAASNEASATP